MSGFYHESVLLEETILNLNIKANGIYVDATVGGGGHAARIASQLNEAGFLIGLDQDEEALIAAAERLQDVKAKVKLIKRNFVNLPSVLKEQNIAQIDGILFDLGVSSHQLDEKKRGFSYQNDAPLDMRMDRSNPFSAAHLVNTASVEELTRIFWEYGEERWSKRIAQFIEKHRRDQYIETTGELAAIIKEAIPAAARRSGPNPARRSFQALRIAVNHELEYLQRVLNDTVGLLKSAGRLAVISFHSLEDRIVKNTFNDLVKICRCPKNFPVCKCNMAGELKIVTKRPIVPSKTETEKNKRARSAKLRVAEKY